MFSLLSYDEANSLRGPSRYLEIAIAFCLSIPKPTSSLAYKQSKRLAT